MLLTTPPSTLPKDAVELMHEANGRWFSFDVGFETVMVLEKKGLADHLGSLSCVESPTFLTTILRELEDAGEVGVYENIHVSIWTYKLRVF